MIKYVNALKLLIVIFFLFSLTLTALSQNTKLVKNKFKGSKQISEKYYVLKSNRDIKHGEYITYYDVTEDEYKLINKGILQQSDIIKEIGYYKLDKKDSLWIIYMPPKRNSVSENSITLSIKKSEGNYKDGKKVGIWTYYNNGVPEKYNHDNNEK